MASYTFGGYTLNNFSGGLGNTIRSKNLDMPMVNPISFVISRRDGMKKSGETVSPRGIDLTLKIIGSSRADLISRLDALQQALAQRSQTLCIHEDGRYYQSVDCIDAKATLAGGADVQACTVKAKFIAYDPYAYAATSSSFDTGVVTLTSANSLWNFAAITVTGGGTYYSYPFLRISNKTSTGSTTLSAGLTSGNNFTSISVNATTFSGAIGDKITITHSGTTQTLNVTVAFSVGATSISVTSFTASVSYVSGDTVAKVTQWTSISITQAQDNQTITASSTNAVPLPNLNGDYVDVQCDPAQQQGMSIQTNNSGKFSDPIGVFPVMEPGTTVFNISIACASAVTAECIISWSPRYVS